MEESTLKLIPLKIDSFPSTLALTVTIHTLQ